MQRKTMRLGRTDSITASTDIVSKLSRLYYSPALLMSQAVNACKYAIRIRKVMLESQEQSMKRNWKRTTSQNRTGKGLKRKIRH